MAINDGYYQAIDKYGDLPPISTKNRPDIPLDNPEFKTSLGPDEIGTGVNPFQHPLEAMQARLREGVGKIEFEFFGTGKGNKERFTPESFGKQEREDMRHLAEINKMKTSVHASVGVQGLAGLGREGFEGNLRDEALKEVKRAIDFAADVTDGGAIVVHTGEWQRPIYDTWRHQGFKGYEGEDKDATFYIVDQQTGRFVSAISKDQVVYEPNYWTAKDKAKEFGYEETRDGKYIDPKNPDAKPMDPNDWVDVNGKYIDPNDIERMFERVPYWNEEHTRFETTRMDWDKLQEKRDWYNKTYDKNLSTEEFFAKTQIENQILQAKGSSLFHGQSYERHRELFDAAKKAYEFYKDIEEKAGPEEARKMAKEDDSLPDVLKAFGDGEKKTPSEIFARVMKQEQLGMKYIHEASAAADVQAKTHEEKWHNLRTVEDYAIKKSAETLANAGIFAMEKTRQKHLKDPLFIAPENWQTTQFGSHPEELRKVVEAGREEMTKRLEPRYGKKEAQKIAKDHIKATLDIGHLNLWRRHFERKEGESLEALDKRFNKWMLQQSEKLAKDGIIGHVHLSDNMGYDDEHLTPGQGNIPIKAFVEKMEKAGVNDMIVEVGSFNPVQGVPDAFSYLGSPVSAAAPQEFRGFQQQHFGYQAPPNYIVGAYVPSNEWSLWSEVNME